MNLLIGAAVVLLLVFVGFIGLPLLFSGRYKAKATVNNPAVVKQRLQELEQEKQESLLSESDYAEAVVETKLSLADELQVQEIKARKNSNVFLLLAVITSFSAGAWVYFNSNQISEIQQWQLAQESLPDLGQRIVVQSDEQVSRQELGQFALALRTKLHHQKDDAVGWLLLGRVLSSLSDFEGAISAFDKSLAIEPDRPGTLFSFAQALLVTGDSSNRAKALRILENLRNITPEDDNVLGLLAVAYTRNNNPDKAIASWNELKSRLPSNAPMQKTIDEQLKALQPIEPGSAKQDSDGTSLIVSLSISQALSTKLKPDAFLFVFVQDANSDNRMPVAVKKLSAQQLAETGSVVVTLSNQDAMLQEFNLSKIKQGRLIARISNDENVAPQSGELQGEVNVSISPGVSAEYSLQIDKELL